MIRVKAFNERHRKCAKVTTAFALIIVAILSILLGIAEKICDIFEGVFESGKRLIAVLAIVLLIAAIILASNFAKNSHHADILDESDTSTDQIIDTLVEAELSKAEEAQNVSTESEKSQAFSLVGKYCVFQSKDSNGNVTYPEGTIDSVNISGGKITLSVGDKVFKYDELYTVMQNAPVNDEDE